MKECKCVGCGKEFSMPEEFTGTILCEDCDPFMQKNTMPKLETPKEYSDRVANEHASGPLTMREVLLQNTLARDAAIHAESAALLKTCGEVLEGAIALLEKFEYTHNAGESETVKFEATISDDLFYSEKHKAEAALAALREARAME